MSKNVLKKLTHDRNFTMIDNKLLQNPCLSMKAKGLACYLLSLPDDWNIVQKELVNHFTDGIESVQTAFKELKQAGYVLVESTRNELGQVTAWRTYVREDLNLPFPNNGEGFSQKRESHIVEPQILETPKLLSTNTTKDLFNKENILSKNDIKNLFNKMWIGYPLKKGKQKAFEALSRILAENKHEQPKLVENICNGLKAHIAEYNALHQTKGQRANDWNPMPYLVTWLNQGRWEDDYKTPEEILQSATPKRGIVDINKVFNQMNPASHEMWDEQKYQQRCKEAQPDPNDWREQLLNAKLQ